MGYTIICPVVFLYTKQTILFKIYRNITKCMIIYLCTDNLN